MNANAHADLILNAVRDALAGSADFEDATVEELEAARADLRVVGTRVDSGVLIVAVQSSDVRDFPIEAHIDAFGDLVFLDV